MTPGMRKAWALFSALLVMLASLVPSLAPIAARAQSGASAVVTIRDAETEAFLRGIAHPLFRAAGVDPALVRITLVQARPINAFVTSGNRMFINTGLIQQSDSVAELAGVLAHETGHIAGGHVARLPEEMRNAFIRSIAGLLLGGAAAMGGGRNVGGNAGAAILLGSQTMAMGELYAFTRAQEQAADQAGVAYLDRLGWSAQGLATLLGRLRVLEDQVDLSTIDVRFTEDPSAGDDVPGFFSALGSGWEGFVGALRVVLAGLGYALPFAVLALAVALGVGAVRRRSSPSHPGAVPARSEP